MNKTTNIPTTPIFVSYYAKRDIICNRSKIGTQFTTQLI